MGDSSKYILSDSALMGVTSVSPILSQKIFFRIFVFSGTVSAAVVSGLLASSYLA